MIRGWQEWSEYSDLCRDTRWFDDETHRAFGLFIARLVRQALPDWTVMYGQLEVTDELIDLSR